jgi:hypothetical protein
MLETIIVHFNIRERNERERKRNICVGKHEEKGDPPKHRCLQYKN